MAERAQNKADDVGQHDGESTSATDQPNGLRDATRLRVWSGYGSEGVQRSCEVEETGAPSAA